MRENVMSRILISIVVLALAGTGPAFAKGTTPPGKWLKVIKDAVRAGLNQPKIVTFNRIFFADTKTAEGAYPVCGFVSFKQKPEQHPDKMPFFGLMTQPSADVTGTFGALQLGQSATKTQDIATLCKKYEIY